MASDLCHLGHPYLATCVTRNCFCCHKSARSSLQCQVGFSQRAAASSFHSSCLSVRGYLRQNLPAAEESLRAQFYDLKSVFTAREQYFLDQDSSI